MTSPLAQAVAASRIRRPLAPLVAGTQVENFASSGSTGTWGTFNSNGSVVKPSAAAPYCTLTSGVASGNNTTISHTGTGVSFGGLVAGTSWITLDLEFPDGVDSNGTIGDKLQFNISSDGKSTKWLFTSLPFQRNFIGRVSITFPCAIATGAWSSTGGEVFDGTTFNYWNLVYQKGIAGTAKRVILRGITIGAKSRPKIVMSYDLGYSGVYNYALPLHDQYNIPGTVNVTRASIDTAGCMTTAQIQELHGKGWAMAIRNGAQQDTFPDVNSLIAEMSAARQWNTDRGLTRGADHCIYPVGVMTPYSKAALQACGIKTGRTTFSSTPLITTDAGSTDMYNLVTCGLGGTDTFNTNGTGTPVKTTLQRCIDFGKSLIIYVHDIGAGDTVAAGGISRNDLAAIMAQIAAYRDANQCDAYTINDWYDSVLV